MSNHESEFEDYEWEHAVNSETGMAQRASPESIKHSRINKQKQNEKRYLQEEKREKFFAAVRGAKGNNAWNGTPDVVVVDDMVEEFKSSASFSQKSQQKSRCALMLGRYDTFKFYSKPLPTTMGPDFKTRSKKGTVQDWKQGISQKQSKRGRRRL